MNSFAQETILQDAFLEKWQHSAQYLLELAARIPDDSLNYRPTERQMSVQEQLLHIRANMLWLGNTYFNPEGMEVPDSKSVPANKAELLDMLEESFTVVNTLVAQANTAALAEKVEFFAGPKTRLQIMNLLQDHVTHHRGQLIVYLNLMNIEPPRYSGW